MNRSSLPASRWCALLTAFCVLTVMLLQPVLAQPPSRSGGDRGGESGGRGFGGPPGGGEGGRGFGGPPGGGEGGRGFGGRGFGGPPGGGEAGRGFSGRGGDRGSSRGGFDASSLLDRLDRNGNGMLDMDEREGPAGFMISRLQREDPSVRVDRPIPMSKIREGFERMRGGGGDRDGDRSRGDDAENDNGLTVEVLVPGFGVEEMLPPVPGFGPTAELFDVELRPEDLQEAEERLRRYDRNRDSFLSKEELGSRWEGNPLDFDRNRDGKLTAAELAVRYARRRTVEQESNRSRQRTDRDRDNRDDKGEAEKPGPYGGRKSFRMEPRNAVEGLPEWFADSDADGDGQVMMHEYTQDWSDAKVEEFFSFDVNRDGTITVRECLGAVQSGASRDGGGRTSSRPAERTASDVGSRGQTETPVASAAGSSGPISSRNLEYAGRIIDRNDANQDGALTVDEWKAMLLDPSPADANGDGRVTREEYAGWLQSRSKG